MTSVPNDTQGSSLGNGERNVHLNHGDEALTGYDSSASISRDGRLCWPMHSHRTVFR